jgi:hypothetical protein
VNKLMLDSGICLPCLSKKFGRAGRDAEYKKIFLIYPGSGIQYRSAYRPEQS